MRRFPRWLRVVIGVLGALFILAGAALGVELYYARKIYHALPGPKLPPREPLATLGSLSATGCAACHAEIAREWRASAHGRATSDVLYRAQLEDEGGPHFCDYCHAPLVEQRPTLVSGLYLFWPRLAPRQRINPRFTPALYHEGVTCVACHQHENTIVGPHAITGAPHATTALPDFGNPTLCATCHHLDIHLGSLKRPVQDTLAEWREYRLKGGDKQCIDCHMPDAGVRPLVAGYPARKSRSHALRGPEDVEFLRTGILVRKVEVDATPDGIRARVTLENASGHRVPTAEPHRLITVSLTALDGSDDHRELSNAAERIERHVDDERLVEAAGDDSTLLPRETRTITVSLAGPLPKEAAELRVRVNFYLWDPDELVALDPHLSTFDALRVVYEEVRPRTSVVP